MSTAAQPGVEQERVSPAQPRDQYLYGVQGLRTVAALMVAVYHIWFNRVSGGVDVFFVVAGYFATSSLLKITTPKHVRTQLYGAMQYLLRTIRRVVPSASVVVVGTVVAGFLFLPRSLWNSTFAHGWASLFHYENWHLISVGHDYLQQGMAASPFQQFWALGIQVQSYVAFVLLALVSAAAAHRFQRSVKWMLLLVVTASCAASLAWSVSLTSSSQPVAYFHFGTRFWEFLIGVLLALILPSTRAPRVLPTIMGWLGLIVMLTFAAVTNPSTKLPGWLALVPIMAGAAIILAARNAADPIILRWRPIVWFADSSFAFYLWHWPVLVYYRWQFSETVGLLSGITIILVSGVLAIATTKLVEQPIRTWKLLHRKPIWSIIVSFGLLLPPVAALGAWQLIDEQQTKKDWQQVASVLDGQPAPANTLVPSTAIAHLDRAQGYDNGCHTPGYSTKLNVCEGGDPQSQLTVAIAGGSHEAQWVDSLAAFGELHGYRLISMTKSGCPFGDVADSDLNVDPTCLTWQSAMEAELLELEPDLLVVMSTRFVKGAEEVPTWKATAIERLTRAGIPVLGIRDNAFLPRRVPECVDQRGVAACGFSRHKAYAPLDQLAIPQLPNFTFVDTVDDYCGEDWCPVTQDGLLMYYDESHFTRTWTMVRGETIHSAIAEQLASR